MAATQATDSELVAIAEMLHADLLKQFSAGQKIGVATVSNDAQEALRQLELQGSAAIILKKMEDFGYVTRFKSEYTLQPRFEE